jgi:hypothetical protein
MNTRLSAAFLESTSTPYFSRRHGLYLTSTHLNNYCLESVMREGSSVQINSALGIAMS